MANVAIVIPTLNEAENILPLLAELSTVAAPIDEVVFVDDDSTDETRARILNWQGKLRVRLVARDRGERGLAGAINAGAQSTTAEVLLVMDADLSHPPDRIVELLAPVLADTADLVIGSRYVAGGSTPGWPLWRRLMSRTASAASYPLTGVHDAMGGFFAVRRECLLRFGGQATGFKIAFEMIVRGRKILRVHEVSIAFQDRARGESKMSFRELLRFSAAWIGAARRRVTPTGAPLASPAKVPPRS